MSSLYDRLGGAPAVDAAVDIFYRKVLADDTISGFFEHTDMNTQAQKQKQFLTFAFGGPNHYTGKDMRQAHKPLVDKGLNETHFDAVLGHLASTLKELGVGESDIQEAANIALSVKKDVLNQD